MLQIILQKTNINQLLSQISITIIHKRYCNPRMILSFSKIHNYIDFCKKRPIKIGNMLLSETKRLKNSKKVSHDFVDICETKTYYLTENVSHGRRLWKLQNY